MRSKLFIGASLAVILVLPPAAWAGADNTFSDGNTTTTSSAASAVASAGSTATSISESYNTRIEAVATQSLTSIVANTTVAATSNASSAIQTGAAQATIGSGTTGIMQAAANSGAGGIVQQGLLLSAAGAVNF
jgi:hypothetical protein